MTRVRKPAWLLPTALILLSLVPVAGGAFRLTELSVGAEVTAGNARFFAAPAPIVLHIVGAGLFCVLGALQFVPGLRRGRWHRFAGRLLVPSGLAGALSGMWMTMWYPLPAGDEGLLTVFRLASGGGWAGCLILGFAATRRRDFARHRAWMMRAYALGLGAGTQALILVLWYAIEGTPNDFARALLMGAAWAINLGIAEWFILRRK